jgi:WD40 repeat protein
MVSGSNDGTIKIWSLPDKKLIKTLSGHSDLGKYIAISADGKTIVSGGNERTIQVWEVP